MNNLLQKITITMLAVFFTSSAFAQSFNPFTQNIEFDPEPTVLGFSCDSLTTVKFTQGLTTATDAPLVAGDELTVTICITGFEWDGTTAASVVSGAYSTNMSWAFDPFAPNCIVGTQNTILPGTGSNPIFPNPLAAGEIVLALHVPSTIPAATVLAVNVNLQPSAYMNATNSAPDDDESTQTQSFCETSALPITVKTFEAKEFNCNVLLSWVTSQEENTSHADVYRKDGAGHFFEKIGTVSLSGNSSIDQTYSYLDETAVDQAEAYEYMIQYVDQDNSFTNSEVRSVLLNCNKSNTEVQLFPNPAANQINFVYNTSEEDIQLYVEIIDIAGRTILSEEKIVDNGSSMFTFNINDLASAQYILRYSSVEENINGSIKFLKN